MKSIANITVSQMYRSTRSMSNDASEVRPAQACRTDSGAFPVSVSPSLISEHVDISARYPHHRRRVNPASLASRLGPELVGELESLLTPGMTEMPSFAARQAIQKKYNIDRRHIYDWYHTKGLRVSTKEKDAAAALVNGIGHGGKVLRSRLPHRNIKQRPSQIEMQPVTSGNNSAPQDSSSSSSGPSTPIMPLTPSSTYNLPAYGSGIPPTAFPLQYFFDDPRGPSSMDDIPLCVEPVTHPSTIAAAEWTRCMPIDRLNSWLSDHPDVASHARVPSSDFPPRSEPVFPISYEQPLPQNQREAYYRHLADALGPAHGVQESVGSYKAFMTQQVQTYYERLLPRDAASAPYTLPTPSTTPVSASMPQNSILRYDGFPGLTESAVYSFSQARPQLQDTDYSKWLLYGGRSLSSSSVPSPASTPSLSSSVQADTNLPWLWSASQMIRDSDSMESTLDISDILESPVLRSRNPTAIGFVTAQMDPSTTTLNDLLRRVEPQSPPVPAFTVQDLAQSDSQVQVLEYPSPDLVSPQTGSRGVCPNMRTTKEPNGLEGVAEATATRNKEKFRTRIKTKRSETVSAGGDA